MTTPSPEREERLAALARVRRRYLDSLPERLASLSRALEAWRRAPGDEGLREDARTLAHRMRGTAGSFGHVEIGLHAGAIEDELVAASGAPSERALEVCARAIDACTGLVASARRSAGLEE